MTNTFFISLAAFAMVGIYGHASAQELKIAHLGDCPTERHEVIKDCQLGYRTFGEPDAAKSNVIVFPTWANGKTEQIIPLVAPGGLLDSSKYFIVAIDSFANGISSSPSNSKLQPRLNFPQITIHDMVVAEHMLLTKALGLDHVFAVVGVSMGGMQTFDWIVSYPTFMDKAVPIVGSPKLPGYDLLLWQSEIEAIKADPGWMDGNYKTNPPTLAAARISALTLSTPIAVDNQMPDGKLPKRMTEASGGMDANDRIRQAEAMMALDISRSAGGNMEAAVQQIRAKLLVIVSKQDHTVTPQPALDLAKLLHAQVLEIDSPCGHVVITCEVGQMGSATAKFLAQ
jgi:homoserine O-acetyltransferase